MSYDHPRFLRSLLDTADCAIVGRVIKRKPLPGVFLRDHPVIKCSLLEMGSYIRCHEHRNMPLEYAEFAAGGGQFPLLDGCVLMSKRPIGVLRDSIRDSERTLESLKATAGALLGLAEA